MFTIVVILCKHSVCKHWMYLPVVNDGLKIVL